MHILKKVIIILFLTAMTLFSMNKLELAINFLDELIFRNPKHVQAYVDKGFIINNLNRDIFAIFRQGPASN